MSLEMYRPDRKSRVYLYIFTIVASLIGWVMFASLRPLTIEANCGEIAEISSGLLGSKRFQYDPLSDYDYVKTQCLEEVLAASETN